MVIRPSKKIRYAVVGLGHIAQVAVLPAFAHARRNSVLHALISHDAQKLAELGERYGAPVRGTYDEYEDCLREVDAVYIALPNSQHAAFTIRAANAGVHVLCEKPLAVTDRECQQMITACQDASVKLMTAYRLHFEPTTLEVLELARSGRLGDLRYATAAFSMRAIPGGIRTNPELGGGTLYDLGVYCIQAARLLFGAEPFQVQAAAIDGGRAGMPGIDEMTTAVLSFEGDRTASFTTSFGAADVSSFRLVGTQGAVHLEPAFEYAEPLVYTLTIDGKTTKKRGKKRDQFAAELLHFSDCVLKDRAPEPSAEEGAQDVRIVEALYESARQGRAIALAPFTPDRAPRRAQAMDLPPVRKPPLVNTEAPHD